MKKTFFLSLMLIFTIKVSAQYPATWNVTGIGGGGSLFSPSINPGNSNEFFAACDMSELFHTTDFGQSYNIVNFQQLQSSNFSSVCFTNTNIRYCINYANNEIVPVKSKDGGVTWDTLSGNPDASQETYSIWANYNNPNQVIIAYYSAIYFSNDAGHSFTNIHNANYNGSGVMIGGVFFDNLNIYIATNDGLFESTTGGPPFTRLTTTGIPVIQKISSFTAAKQNGVTRFFCVTSDSGNVYAGLTGQDYWGFLAGVYTMDNNSGTWTSRMNGITLGTDYPMFIALAANDTSTAYIAGGSSSGNPDVLKTSNGGHSWTPVFNTTSNLNIITGWCGAGGDHAWSWPECAFGISVAANNKDMAIFTDYSDVMKTANGGTSWQQVYVSPSNQHPAGSNTPTKQYYHSVGLENTSAWYLHWSDASNIFAAFTDIYAIRSKDSGVSWAFDYTGPTTNTVYCIAKNDTSGTLYAATSSVHDMYKSYRLQDATLDAGTGQVIFSTDKGATWNTMYNFAHPVYWLATDPNNPDRMYAAVINHSQGAGGIWVTNNLHLGASATWSHLSSPLRTQGHPATITVLNNGNVLCSFSGRRNASGAFTDSSGVFLYNTTTSSWSDVSDANEIYWCHDVVVDPNDATQNTWYCCVYSGWGGHGNGMGGLYKTTNAGGLWTKVLDNVDVSSCTFNPNNANELFVTTMSYGLWYSNNINNATPTFNLVNSYDFSAPERVFFNPFDNTKIWVTSFGHGLQWGDMNLTGLQVTEQNKNNLLVYPNPFSTSTTILINDNCKETNVNCKLFNVMGKEVMNINENNISNNTIKINRNGLTCGIYFYRISNSNGLIGAGKLVVE